MDTLVFEKAFTFLLQLDIICSRNVNVIVRRCVYESDLGEDK